MATGDSGASPEVRRQLELEDRAKHIIARVRANSVFMLGVKKAAQERASGKSGTPLRDLKRKDG